jgi:hypothetical protein
MFLFLSNILSAPGKPGHIKSGSVCVSKLPPEKAAGHPNVERPAALF